MYDKTLFQRYVDAFSHLHVKVTAGQRAPHKAIMLLSVIDLIETGVISSNRIYYTQQLDSQFHHNWVRYVAYLDGYSARSATPFFHMAYEPFWTLKLREDCSQTEKELADARIYMNPEIMKEAIDFAQIDSDLYELFKDSVVRAKFRVLLISSYCNFS
jgi:putative restriction endonuclease